VKSAHNTLYGVLRMAQVHTDDNTITLTFRFDFHKKQFNQGKNMKTLHEIVATVYGRPHTITMNVSKTAKQPAKILPEPSRDMPLANISNIFGGAELLD
jgi:hypothetical protein